MFTLLIILLLSGMDLKNEHIPNTLNTIFFLGNIIFIIALKELKAQTYVFAGINYFN